MSHNFQWKNLLIKNFRVTVMTKCMPVIAKEFEIESGLKLKGFSIDHWIKSVLIINFPYCIKNRISKFITKSVFLNSRHESRKSTKTWRQTCSNCWSSNYWRWMLYYINHIIWWIYLSNIYFKVSLSLRRYLSRLRQT